MNFQKLIKLLEEKLIENDFSDFIIEKDTNSNSLFIISESGFDIGILISESGNVFFECQLASEVQELKRIAMLEMLNHLSFKYHISFVLDENDDVYLKYIFITCGDEIKICEQILVTLNYLINIILIFIYIDDIMCII